MAKVNNQMQLFEDKTDWENQIRVSALDHNRLIKKISYNHVCRMTIEDMNKQMQMQLDHIKVKVSDEVWKHAIKNGEVGNGANVAAYAFASPPEAPTEMDNRRFSSIPVATGG